MFKKHKFLFLWLCLDGLTVILHIALSGITGFFDLDKEQNLPTVYQSFKLILAGNMVLFIAWLELSVLKTRDKARLWFMAILAVLFLYIGLDELGQLHETVEFYVQEVSPGFAFFVVETAKSLGIKSAVWLLYYAPFILASIPFFIYLIYYSFKVCGKKTYLIVFMTLLFFLVVCLEWIGSAGVYWGWHYQVIMIAEESAEKVGASLGLYYVWLILKETKTKLEKK